jgi:hypothetical protein
MQIPTRGSSGEPTRFFFLTFGYDKLENFIQTNFAMMQHHKYGYSDIEDMISWERQIYVSLLSKYIKDENERIKLRKLQR